MSYRAKRPNLEIETLNYLITSAHVEPFVLQSFAFLLPQTKMEYFQINEHELCLQKLLNLRSLKSESPFDETIQILCEREISIEHFYAFFLAFRNGAKFVNRSRIKSVVDGCINGGIVDVIIDLINRFNYNHEKSIVENQTISRPSNISIQYQRQLRSCYDKLTRVLFFCVDYVEMSADTVSKLRRYFEKKSQIILNDSAYIAVLFTAIKANIFSLTLYLDDCETVDRIISIIQLVKQTDLSQQSFLLELHKICCELILRVQCRNSDAEFIQMLSIIESLYESSIEKTTLIEYWENQSFIENLFLNISPQTYFHVFEALAILTNHPKCAEKSYAVGCNGTVFSWNKILRFINECYG